MSRIESRPTHDGAYDFLCEFAGVSKSTLETLEKKLSDVGVASVSFITSTEGFVFPPLMPDAQEHLGFLELMKTWIAMPFRNWSMPTNSIRNTLALPYSRCTFFIHLHIAGPGVPQTSCRYHSLCSRVQGWPAGMVFRFPQQIAFTVLFLQIPRVEYTEQENETWSAVYTKLMKLAPTHACKQCAQWSIESC